MAVKGTIMSLKMQEVYNFNPEELKWKYPEIQM